MFDSASIQATGFKPPVSLAEGIERTIKYEFIHKTVGELFFTE